jgi:hypothetical protein
VANSTGTADPIDTSDSNPHVEMPVLLITLASSVTSAFVAEERIETFEELRT